MRSAALALILPLAVLGACQPRADQTSGPRCEGSAALAVSQTGTLNVVWGAGTRFYVRVGERTLELLIDRPDLVSSDILQGLATRRVRVDGRESTSAAKVCADAVTALEGSSR